MKIFRWRGQDQHLAEGLSDHRVDAVATARFFNFVGDGLVKAREKLLQREIQFTYLGF